MFFVPVSIPKGKATNRRELGSKLTEKVFQSPKGRLQTQAPGASENAIRMFQSPKGRLQTHELGHAVLHQNRFNPQREGYKH